MIDHLISPFAPHICCGCSEYGSILCESCKDDIVSEDFGRCIWCLKPTARTHQCTECGLKSGVQDAWVVGERTTTLKRILNDYKFESRRGAAHTLAHLLDTTLPTLPPDTIVTWVPTAPAHIRQRGFDHAARLAKGFAKARRLPAQALLRGHHTQSQHELGRSARERAAESAFSLRIPSVLATVLLIDDILTTGATLRACSRQLSEAGSTVYVAVVARQPL